MSTWSTWGGTSAYGEDEDEDEEQYQVPFVVVQSIVCKVLLRTEALLAIRLASALLY